MNYREIKSAVTLLHRIALNLNVPVMLMQTQLFRVFQQVFSAPRDARYEELRRLGQFVMRQFVKLTPTNPKIYAELLFFKSNRECYEISHGYSESMEGNEAKQKAWSEEQEEELQRLFMENQESPQTDQDVIDWILDNLIEKTRTRRGVIKKLKDLGLIFKAPTKKSNAAAVNKNLFIKDEDNKLQELYDEHRLEADCLKRIMVVFDKKRSKKAVLKRMVQLGLIADESEILPEKELKSRKERGEQNSSSESSDEEEAVTSAPSRNFNLNQREAVALRAELEESQKEAIEWIVESLNEAAEDFEEASDEVDDAIPIVPFTESQKSAVDDSQFQKLLAALNFIVPKDRESYWKIPANMMPDELRQRAKLLLGKEVPVDEDKQLESEDEDEDLFSKLRNQRDALMYNEGDSPTAVKGTKQKLQKVVEKVTSEEESSDEDQQNIIKRKNQQPIMESDGLDINTQELKQRLAELNDSSDDEQNATTQKKKNLLESSDDDELPTILRKRKSVKRDRSELEEETPDENEMNASNNNQLKRIRRIADSSDDE